MGDAPEGDKTEEPTPRRLAESRRRGEVAQSRDLSGAFAMAAVFTVCVLGAGGAIAGFVAYLRSVSMSAAAGGSAQGALALGLGQAGRLLAMPLGLAAVAVVGAGLMQTGGLISMAAFRLDFARVQPSLKRVLSVSALAAVAKGTLKVGLVAALTWVTLAPLVHSLASLTGAGPRAVLAAIGTVAGSLGLRLVLAAVALGAADYLWQRREHLRSLRMTREEVKREHKESEGDPHHKAERQRLHRELGEQRMLNDVRKADFVVVNPDHIAVALRYDRNGQAAPMVLAKGERLLAEKIKEVAREAGVPIFRDVGLARSLHALEEGDEIPEALYEAVAEILRVVYG